jgi:hypothetical protein
MNFIRKLTLTALTLSIVAVWGCASIGLFLDLPI